MKTSYIIDHLLSSEIELQQYFSEIKDEENGLVRNAFSTSLVIGNILNELQDNFVTFGMIHNHRIFFIKCYFFSSGELCMIQLSELALRILLSLPQHSSASVVFQL